MNIQYTGKNIDLTPGIKAHIEDKLLKLERYAPQIIDAHIVIETEKYLYEAEVTLLAKNLRAFGEASSKENLFAAIDLACGRVEKQLKRFREKVKDHHHAKGIEYVLFSEEGASQEEVSAILDEGQKPKIIHSENFQVKPMALEEASMQFSLSGEPFMVFLNASNQKVSVLYKREDGNHGLIEPNF